MSANDILTFGKSTVELKMHEILDISGKKYDTLLEAMRYSVEAGGKRLRPALLLEFYRLCGGKEIDDAARFAAALEFIHTYSLIHDDLPCMDNDDMRRGRPSCHIKFGEDTALLAGDALLTLAFEAAAGCNKIDADNVRRAILVLARNAGANGMVGGQVIDLATENGNSSLETVCEMYSLKTGALICAAAEIGCILAGADVGLVKSAVKFAEKIGLAFQIVDDILDLTSTAEELGKPIGSDSKNQKSTYVSFVGIESAKRDVEILTTDALSAMSLFGDEAQDICSLAKMLINRTN